MENINELLDELIVISKSLLLENKVSKLESLKERLHSNETEIIIPLIGEFSSGKTSLINSLSETLELETAITPTTATIFEIRFSRDVDNAEIISADGEISKVDSIQDIINKNLKHDDLVKIYNTNKNIPPSIVLVDTPGISSSLIEHKKALTNYLPLADAIFLIVDINQGLTASLLEFIKQMNLLKRQTYIVITKSDLKSPEDCNKQLSYIKNNINYPVNDIINVSAKSKDIHKFYSLIKKVNDDKFKIIKDSIEKNIFAIVRSVLEHIKNQISDLKLNDIELSNKITEISKTVDLSKSILNNSYAELENKLEEIKVKSIKIFNDRINKETYNVISNALQNKEDLESKLQDKIIIMIEYVINCIYKDDIRNYLSGFYESLNKNLKNQRVLFINDLDFGEISDYNLTFNSGIPVLDTITSGLKATLEYMKLNERILSKIMGKVLSGIDKSITKGTGKTVKQPVTTTKQSIKNSKDSYDILGNLTDHTFELIDNIGFLITRPILEKRINEVLDEIIIPDFQTQINRMNTNIFIQIKDHINSEIEKGNEDLLKSLQMLNNKKNEDNDKYNYYAENLKKQETILNNYLLIEKSF